jgi:virginiamycin B lyase
MLARFLAILLVLALTAVQALAAESKVYRLPEGAGPHDTAPAPDGKVWYTAQGMGASVSVRDHAEV